jgi:uncharacterized protein YecT (DUF1311 family)
VTVALDGGTIRHNGTLRGGHVSVFLLHGVHHDIGLLRVRVRQRLSAAKQQRTVLWLLLFATLPLVASGCDSSADTTPQRGATTRPTLPRIHERFTLLPCPKGAAGKTTVGIEGCVEHQLLRTDKKIVTSQRAILRRLGTKGRSAFASAERSWLGYRHAYCNARAASYEGGSIAPVIFITCEVSINKSHLRQLLSFRRELQR